MPTTPIYGLRTPELPDANNVPADMAVLAQGVENALGRVAMSGSGPSGRWVRFADGTQICWISTTRTDIAITIPYGPLFTSEWTWTYPAAFNDTPTITCSRFKSGTSASWGTVKETYSTQATLRALDAYSRAAGTATYIAATAIGSWK